MELNAAGIPVDLFKMTMTQQAAPVGLRLFSRFWAPFADGINADMAFIARRIQYLKRWETASYRYPPPQLVDDIERRQLEMQMAQAGLVARGWALKQVDTNLRDQTRQKFEDLQVEAEEQAKFEQRTDAFQFSRQLAQAGPPGAAPQPPGAPQQPGAPAPQGGGGAGGAPQPGQAGGAPAGTAPPGTDPLAGLIPQPGAKIDPATMYSQAQSAAETLMGMSDGERTSRLLEIKKQNPPFHGIVKQILADKRSQARSQGGRMLLQQQYGQGGQGGQQPTG
jgi:hypothetical protein